MSDPRHKPDINVNHHHVAGQPAGGLNTGSGHVHVNIYLSPMNHLGQMQNQQYPNAAIDVPQVEQGGATGGAPGGAPGGTQGSAPGGTPRGAQGQPKPVVKPKQSAAAKPMEKKDIVKQFAAARKRGRPKKEVRASRVYCIVCMWCYRLLIVMVVEIRIRKKQLQHARIRRFKRSMRHRRMTMRTSRF